MVARARSLLLVAALLPPVGAEQPPSVDGQLKAQLQALARSSDFTSFSDDGIGLAISQKGLQSLIADITLTEEYEGVLSVAASHPAVSLVQGDNRIHVTFAVAVSFILFDGAATGAVECAFLPRFSLQSGELSLSKPEIVATTIDGLPQEYGAIVTGVLNELVVDEYDGRVIKRLDLPNLRQMTALIGDAVITEFAVKDGWLRLYLMRHKPGEHRGGAKAGDR